MDNFGYVTVKGAAPYLYAGGSVLDKYYNTNYAGDVDLFIANRNVEIEYDKTLFFPHRYSQAAYFAEDHEELDVIRLTPYEKSKYPCIDIVMLSNCGAKTQQELHDYLVNCFDIKICALAWNGTDFLIPSSDVVNMHWKLTSTSGSNLLKNISRREKYLDRGFTFILSKTLKISDLK